MKAMTVSVKQLEKKMSLVESETMLLEKINEKLRRKYHEQNKVVGRRMGKLVKSVATSFVGTVKCISRPNSKCSFRETEELRCFNED